MGYILRREVRDALPPGVLTPAERLLVLELADICSDETREGWPGAARLAELTDLSERSVQETLNRIGKKWLELRVPLGKSETGKVFYSHAGRRTTFRFPRLLRREGATDPGSYGATDPGAYAEQDATDPGGRCDGSVEKVRQIRGPSPQGTSQKNHSSLSPREDDAEAATASTSEPERETEEASPNIPTDNPVHRLLLDAGCPPERLTEVGARITAECLPRGFGWWRTVAANGDLKVHVAAFLEADPTAGVCPDCADTGTAGDWMNPHPCDCLWQRDPTAARKAFVPLLAAFEPCPHGVPGGDQRAPNGWRYCAGCRGPGWVDPDVQPRIKDRINSSHRSTGSLRAEQALRVAANLDAKAIGNGRYQPWQPPENQDEYDESLY